MKKFFNSLALVAALLVGANVQAAVLESEDDSIDIEINVFAELEQSYKVLVENDDISGSGAVGLISLNGSAGPFNALNSIAGAACKDGADVTATYADAGTTCSVDVGPLSSSADSKLQFSVDMDVKVEISGPGTIDLDASMLGVSQGDEVFASPVLTFTSSSSASVVGLEDQDTDNLNWSADAPLNGGPLYDDTIIVDLTFVQ